MDHHHNNFLSIFCGAVFGGTKAVLSASSEITLDKVFQVVLFAAIGALVGLVVKDLYAVAKKRFKK